MVIVIEGGGGVLKDPMKLSADIRHARGEILLCAKKRQQEPFRKGEREKRGREGGSYYHYEG